jgi:hypothetical protein
MNVYHCVKDTGDKLFTGANDTGDKFITGVRVTDFLVIACVIDNNNKFITGVVDTGEQLSLINLSPVKTTPVNNYRWCH